jgi:putative ABC transport system permease protein
VLLQDIRYAFRTLFANRWVTAVAVLCLSLGIGVNAAIFSVVDGIMLQPYPYADADRLIVLSSANAQLRIRRTGVSYPDFKDWRDQNTTLAGMAAFQGRSLTIADGVGEPERFAGSAVSWTLFGLLGTPPVLGRDFGPNDDRPGAEPVVMLSDDVWRLRYNADPTVIGRRITVNGWVRTVIGVMPPNFRFPENQRLWVPIEPTAEPSVRNERGNQVFARLKPGVTIDQAAADLGGIAQRLSQTYPTQNENWTAVSRPIREWMLPEQVELMILTMMGAVTLVLLIACSNVANLLLARASVRHREISIRAALGAGRWRIVRQLLTEAVIIGLISAPFGVALARLGLRLMDLGIPPDSVPYFIHWSLDGRTLAYTIAVSMLTGIVFGLAPALQAARSNLQESLKEGGRGSAGGKRGRVRNALVVAEISMSLVLLIGASLFVRSFMNLQHASVGFETSPLLTMRFYLPGAAYESPDAKARRVQEIVRRVEGVAGVQSAFASNFVPLGGGGSEGSVIIEGKAAERGKEPSIAFVAATPHLRKTIGVALVRGRDITESEETTRTPVAVVNQAMAKELWTGSDPIGRRFRMTRTGEPAEWFTVVGVVADFRHYQGDNDDEVFPSAYVPYSFDPALNTGVTVRASGDPARLTSSVREQIRLADGSLPVFQVTTMEDLRQRSFWQQRLFGWMFSVFGGIALVLASIGIYGVLSYSVSQRTQEIGVRLALGAERRDVLRLVVGQGLRLAAIGVVIGIAGAFGATRVLKSVLYNVAPTDPVSFGGVAVFLALVALAASYLPARRAMAVDPIVALRAE